MIDRGALYVLDEIIAVIEGNYHFPDDIHDLLLEISELCDEYMGAGFTYLVNREDDGDIEPQTISIV